MLSLEDLRREVIENARERIAQHEREINIALGRIKNQFARACRVSREYMTYEDLKNYQIEYCYLVDELQRGPIFFKDDVIDKIDNLIHEILELANKNEEQQEETTNTNE